jgi:hypothetical protein
MLFGRLARLRNALPPSSISANNSFRQIQMFSQDFKEFLQLLNDYHVEYLLVGGYAVGFYGYPRYTGDLDIWVKPSRENAERLNSVLEEFGFGALNVSAEDFVKENAVIQLGYPPLRIDLVTTLDGVSFDECYVRKHTHIAGGISADFISLDDLKRNKKATGRARDMDDLENLK